MYSCGRMRALSRHAPVRAAPAASRAPGPAQAEARARTSLESRLNLVGSRGSTVTRHHLAELEVGVSALRARLSRRSWPAKAPTWHDMFNEV